MNLADGTLCFWSGRSWVDRFVRIWTQSTWDHVGIVLDGLLYEALPPRVTSGPLSPARLPLWTATLPEALNWAAGAALARSLVGKPYGWANDALAGLGCRRRLPGEVECAQLVLAVLGAAGIRNAGTVVATPEAVAMLVGGAGATFRRVDKWTA
ncbi:MAG: hypothetical protein ACYCOR_19145 [Acidobacteriaceae bacterium]